MLRGWRYLLQRDMLLGHLYQRDMLPRGHHLLQQRDMLRGRRYLLQRDMLLGHLYQRDMLPRGHHLLQQRDMLQSGSEFVLRRRVHCV